jgi:hypothetical protein
MTNRPLLVLSALVALTGGLAACSSSGDVSPNSSTSANANAQQQLDLGRQFAQCARDHGYPNFQDPQWNGDKLEYEAPADGGKEQLDEIAQIPECKTISDQIRGHNRSENPTPSAADLQKLMQFAKCMREQGLTEWPDPKADGTFPITGTPLENEGQSERYFNALDACKHLYDKRITTS